MKSYKSLLAFILCSVLFISSPFLTRKWERGGSQAVISWDAFGYWFYLPSFAYDDPARLAKYESLNQKYHPGSDALDYAFFQPATGKYVMFYPCGLAIINIPAFIAGHIGAKIGGYDVDGFSLPYQIAALFWCVLVSCFGVWLLRSLLLRYFDDWLVACLLLVLCVGTNFYNFAVFSPLTHAFLFAIYTAILCLTDSFYRDERKRLWYVVLIGLLSGIATITRPTEIICVLIPLLWGVRDWEIFKERVNFFLKKKPIVPVVYLMSAFIAALPQLIYWKVYAGHWIFFSYHGDDKTFSFLHPHILNVLISYKKGWLMYTPVMILSLLGFYQLYRSYRQIFWSIATFTVINIYLISAWDCWWYGGSFSMRPMIDSYPLLVFPMAAFLHDFLCRKYLRYPVILFLIFCIWLNLLMTYQANGGNMIDQEGMNKAYYWRIFGKTHIASEDKKLIDTQEEMPDRLTTGLKEIYHSDLHKEGQPDSIGMHDGKPVFKIYKDVKGTDKIKIPVDKDHHRGWYRAYVNVYFPVKEWQVWSQTLCIISFNKGDKEIKTNVMRLQRIMDQNEWRQLYIDIKVPNDADFDSLVIYFWAPDSSKPVSLSDFHVAYTPDE